MDSDQPLISCICITRGKPRLLQRAIGCFEAQTYLHKELVVLYEEDDEPTRRFVAENSFAHHIRFIKAKALPRQPLGQLRNMAIEQSHGAFICQWDDDDWYHINRLQFQYNALHKACSKASVMTQWLVFDHTRGSAYISNRRLWEGSVLCEKKVLQQKQYAPVSIGEDTVVIDYLKDNDHICEMNDHAGLYIYVYHGANTWNAAHWDLIFKWSHPLQPEKSDSISRILQGEYSQAAGSHLIDQLLKEALPSLP